MHSDGAALDVEPQRAALIPGFNEVRRAALSAGALYLLSDLGRGVTGEILHIDAGYHVVGMKNEDAPDLSVVKE